MVGVMLIVNKGLIDKRNFRCEWRISGPVALLTGG